jgi:hypothetical protein
MTKPKAPRWRITVESWATEGADWYGRRVFYVAASDLPAAVRAVAELSPSEYLDEDGIELAHGRITDMQRGDDLLRRVRRRRRERTER